MFKLPTAVPAPAKIALAIVACALTVTARPAYAIDLNPVRSGWFTDLGQTARNALATNQNYQTGLTGGNEFRSFFVFDLSGISGTITGATLLVYNPVIPPDTGDGYTGDATETYQLTSSTSSPTDLQGNFASGSATGQTVFGTLGTGSVYSTYNASTADNGNTIALSFSSAGLADLNSAIGGQTGFGGRLTTLAGNNGTQTLFSFTDPTSGNGLNDTPAIILRLSTSNATAPEPATLLLLLPVVGVIAARRRK